MGSWCHHLNLNNQNDLENILQNEKRVLLLGPPGVGKSSALKQFAETGYTYISNKQDLLNLISGNQKGPVILDDFYFIFLQCDQSDKKKLEALLSSDEKLCISTTPYRWEWLLEHWNSSEKSLTPDVSSKKNIVNFNQECVKVLCGYDKEDAKQKVCFILSENKELLQPGQDPKKTTDKIIDHLRYKYEFNRLFHEESADIPENFVTYVPFAIYSIMLPKKTLLGGQWLLKDIAKDFWVKITEQDLKDVVAILGQHIGVLAAGVIAANMPFVLLSLGVALRNKNKNKNGEEFNFLKKLLDLSPLEMEKVEKHLNIQPFTLQTIKDSFDPKTIARINSAHDDLKDQFTLLESKFDDIDDKFTKFYSDFERVNLFFNERIEKSVQPANKVINPTGWMKKSLDIDFTSVDEIETVGRENIVDKFVRRIEGGTKILILRGQTGVGKSTVAREIARKLEEKGYFVGVPDFSEDRIEYIAEGLKANSAGKRGSVLISDSWDEFEVDENAVLLALNSENHLRILLDRALPLCDCILIMCRNETYALLKEYFNNLKGINTPTRSGIIEKNKCEFELQPLKWEDIRQVLDRLWEDSEQTKANLENIKIISQVDGKGWNPLISILAGIWVNSGGSLKDITTKQDFLNRYVEDRYFKRSGSETDDYFQDAIEIIAFTRGISEEDLAGLLCLQKGRRQWKEGISPRLSSFSRKGESKDHYHITPDIIGDIIFQQHCLREDKFESLVGDLQKMPVYSVGVSLNLGIAFGAGIYCTSYADFLVENLKDTEINPEDYVAVIRTLLLTGNIPLSAGNIDAQKLRLGAEKDSQLLSETYNIHIDSEMLLVNILASFISNSAVAGTAWEKSLKDTDNLANQTSQSFDSETFMENVYSMAISKISAKQTMDQGREWVQHITELANQTSQSFDSETFMENVYSMAIWMISDQQTVDQGREWVQHITELANQTSQSFDSETFMVNVYSMAISKISAKQTVDQGREWVQHITELANQTSQSFDSETFMENVYSMAISNISAKQTVDQGREWVQHITELANQTSQSFDSETFMENVYSMAISNISAKQTVDQGREWVQHITELANQTSQSFDSEKFMVNVYSMAISKISAKQTVDQGREWVQHITELANQTSQSFDSEKFMENVYSMAISNISAKQTVDQGREWVQHITELANQTSQSFDSEKFMVNVDTALMFHLNNSFNNIQSKNDLLYRQYQWRMYLIEHRIIESGALFSNSTIIQDFVLKTAQLIMQFSQNIKEDLEIIGVAIANADNHDFKTGIAGEFYLPYLFELSQLEESEQRNELVNQAIETLKSLLELADFDYSISYIIAAFAINKVEDKTITELVLKQSSDFLKTIELSIHILDQKSNENFCENLALLWNILPLGIGEDEEVQLLFENIRKEKGCA